MNGELIKESSVIIMVNKTGELVILTKSIDVTNAPFLIGDIKIDIKLEAQESQNTFTLIGDL